MKARPIVFAIVAVAAVLHATTTASSTAFAQQAPSPPYLSQLPSVERVMRDVKGSDPIDTAARQAGVFWQLRKVIDDMALRQGRNDRQQTPGEQALKQQYYVAYYNVWQPVEKALAQDRPRLFKLQGYTVDRDLLGDVLERLGSPALRAEYFTARGQLDARSQAPNRAPGNAAPPRTPQPAAASAAASDTSSCPVSDRPSVARPAARGSSSVSIIGDGYVYTYGRKDDSGRVVDPSFTEKGNFVNTLLFLLDDDADRVLQSAGIQPGIMGSRFGMMTMVEIGTGLESVPGASVISGFGQLFGAGQVASQFAGFAKEDFDCGMKALRVHSVAQATTDANARATMTGVPLGTYYLYGRFYRVTKPAPSGGIYWNLKIDVKPGQNVVRLGVDNTAWQQR